MLAACVPADRAFSVQPWRGVVTRHEISLGIAPSECLPLSGDVKLAASQAIVGPHARPVCFLVERVAFRMNATARDPLPLRDA
jgi:hypothetical protein